MKKQLLMILMMGIVGLGISSCEDPLTNDLLPETVSGEVSTETIMKVMSMRFRAQGLAEDFRFDGFDGDMNHEGGRANNGNRRREGRNRGAANLGQRGFGEFNTNGGSEGEGEGEGEGEHWDDEDWDEEEGYDSCAEITEVENEDGSITTTIDYGTEGCVEHFALISGKITITEFEDEGSFTYEMIFDNYSETYESDSVDGFDLDSFTLNGFYRSNGTFEVIEGDDEEDCHHGNFTETHESELTITFADGSWESFSSDGEIRETDDSFEVVSANFEGSNSEGDTFSGSVIETLILDYECGWDVFIFTSGLESWTVNSNNIEVDFGDGSCDNIVSITMDGATLEIDLDKDWFGDDDEEEDEG
jgi:hypothetical protein